MHRHLYVKSLFVEPKISIYFLQNTLHLNPILSQMIPDHIITAYFSETHFNIIFLCAVFSTLFLPEFCIHSLCTHVCIQPWQYMLHCIVQIVQLTNPVTSNNNGNSNINWVWYSRHIMPPITATKLSRFCHVFCDTVVSLRVGMC